MKSSQSLSSLVLVLFTLNSRIVLFCSFLLNACKKHSRANAYTFSLSLEPIPQDSQCVFFLEHLPLPPTDLTHLQGPLQITSFMKLSYKMWFLFPLNSKSGPCSPSVYLPMSIFVPISYSLYQNAFASGIWCLLPATPPRRLEQCLACVRSLATLFKFACVFSPHEFRNRVSCTTVKDVEARSLS